MVVQAIEMTPTQNWSQMNNTLWQAYMAADSREKEREIEAKFVEANAKMLNKKIASIPVVPLGAVADVEDVAQTVLCEYLEALRRSKAQGRKTYRVDVFKIAENGARASLSNTCSPGGINTPYTTKKRMLRKGLNPTAIVISVNDCEEGEDETGIEKRKQALMSNCRSAEDIVLDNIASDIIRNDIRKALATLDAEDRDIIIMRYMNETGKPAPWKEIGIKYGLTEGGARFRCTQAFKKLKEKCINLELYR